MFVSKLGNLPPLPQISQTKCIIDIENMSLYILIDIDVYVIDIYIDNQPSSNI